VIVFTLCFVLCGPMESEVVEMPGTNNTQFNPAKYLSTVGVKQQTVHVNNIGTLAVCNPLRVLSNERDRLTCAIRPFSKERAGFVLSDGVAFAILEELCFATPRGARLCEEVLGCAIICDLDGSSALMLSKIIGKLQLQNSFITHTVKRLLYKYLERLVVRFPRTMASMGMA
jgi:hypothetical protein